MTGYRYNPEPPDEDADDERERRRNREPNGWEEDEIEREVRSLLESANG